MEGIFCANFAYSRGGWPPCQRVWHAECYTCLGEGLFPMERIEDEAGNKWHSEDQRRADLNAGVKGAHVCVPFQCEVCWVRNIAQRDPTPLDTTTYYCIRRANLDAMAGSSRRTISSHLGRNKTIIRNAEAANKPPSLYARGPNPLSDSGGMNQALDVLLHTITAKGLRTQ